MRFFAHKGSGSFDTGVFPLFRIGATWRDMADGITLTRPHIGLYGYTDRGTRWLNLASRGLGAGLLGAATIAALLLVLP